MANEVRCFLFVFVRVCGFGPQGFFGGIAAKPFILHGLCFRCLFLVSFSFGFGFFLRRFLEVFWARPGVVRGSACGAQPFTLEVVLALAVFFYSLFLWLCSL